MPKTIDKKSYKVKANVKITMLHVAGYTLQVDEPKNSAGFQNLWNQVIRPF
jgi:hypothetical protein